MRADLYSINTELMEAQRLMGAYSLRLSDKEDDLRRLKKALTKLGNNKSDFTESKGICLEPKFTKTTLYGENADHLDTLRDDALQVSFEAIPNEQVRDAADKISERMETLQQEIASLQGSISSLETQLATLSAKKLEVENRS
ncbi:DUF5082 family protein [Lentibacillus sp. N15]|uniref:YwqH-like family protein n=1 Tax=Lentibacillus songyuanensis TaxID=3136161 RepID=UPI0031B9C058